jgi:hypothetical protein
MNTIEANTSGENIIVFLKASQMEKRGSAVHSTCKTAARDSAPALCRTRFGRNPRARVSAENDRAVLSRTADGVAVRAGRGTQFGPLVDAAQSYAIPFRQKSCARLSRSPTMNLDIQEYRVPGVFLARNNSIRVYRIH